MAFFSLSPRAIYFPPIFGRMPWKYLINAGCSLSTSLSLLRPTLSLWHMRCTWSNRRGEGSPATPPSGVWNKTFLVFLMLFSPPEAFRCARTKNRKSGGPAYTAGWLMTSDDGKRPFQFIVFCDFSRFSLSSEKISLGNWFSVWRFDIYLRDTSIWYTMAFVTIVKCHATDTYFDFVVFCRNKFVLQNFRCIFVRL